ncbi:MAG: 4Fe-4S dicluster domain-containing protein [Anaerolineales bacterium]|nr:4Fe-4S dicluster domain-containing protein [Anaerolineales bacterium]
MLSLVEKILFVIAVGVSLYYTQVTFSKMITVVQRGQGQLNLDHLPPRLWTALRALVNQGGIIRHRPVTSLFHYFIAWGFIYYVLVNAVDVLEAFIPGFHIPGMLGNLYRLLADLLTVAVLIGMTYFLVRRFLVNSAVLTIRDNVTLHPKAAAGMRTDSLLVGGFIWGHVGFRFLGTAFLVALHGGDPWQPFASLLAAPLDGLPETAQLIGWHTSWWLAIGLILAFVPYFPYTKHAHLFVGPFNFMTRPPRRALGALDPINFEDESIEQFGATTLTDLSQTQLVDPFACIMCSRCQEVCPAYTTGKPLSPSALEINKRYHIWDQMAALAGGEADESPLLEWAISPSAVWACTTCGACLDVCPVGNKPMFDIMDIRRSQVLMASEFPAELKGAFTGLERNGNPWQMTDDRLAWTKPLDFAVPTVEENPDFEVLFWVGCAGAFDPGAQEIARATATVLHAAGVNFAVLGNDETCTGDTARRAGNEYLFYEMALGNIETLNAVGADQKKIVASCPHCLHTIGTEYADYGGHYTVLHHTQLISELIGAGRLKLNGSNQLEKVAFHDPCYLGRHNGVYDAPRLTLAQAGATLLEMDRNRSDSFCCGAGGAQMWKEEEHGSAAVNETRFAEGRATGADVLAVGCPFCARMMTDANTNAGSPMVVQDVAQLVAAALQK